MAQADTLQEIYASIADIYDQLCNSSSTADPITSITAPITVDATDWKVPVINFDNPNSIQAITDAQTQINNLLGVTFTFAQTEVSAFESTLVNPQGVIVPIPKDSPIMLLPKLIKILVLYQAPLSVIANILLKIIEDILLEFIRQKFLEKKGQLCGGLTIASATLIKIPTNAQKMVFIFSNIPAWVSKTFLPANFDTSVIQPAPSTVPDLAKYILSGLGNVYFGFALTSNGICTNLLGQVDQVLQQTSNDIFWESEKKLQFARQICDIPDYESFTNYQRYALIVPNFDNTCAIGFLNLA